MRRTLLALVAAGLAATLAGAAHAEVADPVKVDGGLVSGTRAWGAGVRMYRGVPFAAAPTGDRRWRPPQPVTAWAGVKAADAFSPGCLQERRPMFTAEWNTGANGYSEDCLYLNVWTPAGKATDKLPVMVWVYGGGGKEGSGGEALYDPSNLAKRGVVVVTFNYRVNVFGWMAHPELSAESPHKASGDYGALDQVAALQWVKRNIAAFGGDPEKVTIFGESGGSRSVNWLMASPLAKGLFRGAIGESHTVFDTVASQAQAEARGVEFGKQVGAKSLADLRAMSGEDLLAAYQKRPVAMNAVTIDGWFLPDQVRTIFETGKQNDAALITGGNNDEPGDSRRREGPPTTLEQYQAWARKTFGDRADRLLAIYPAKSDADVARAYKIFQRDANLSGHRTWVALQTKTGRQPAYLYNFSHNTPAYGPDNQTPTRRGAPHGSEISYVFDNLRNQDRPWTAEDQKVASGMADYWTNFAKTLDPNGPGLPRWPKYDPANEQLLNIGATAKAQKVENPEGLDLQDAHNQGFTH